MFFFYNALFGCDCLTWYNIYCILTRPWLSPWMKSISSEFDIIIHVIASHLSGHCDVISNRMWRHRQNENWVCETRGRCVKIVIFVVIYGFVMSCKKWNNVCTLVTNCFNVHRVLFWSSVSLEYLHHYLCLSNYSHRKLLFCFTEPEIRHQPQNTYAMKQDTLIAISCHGNCT